MKEIKFRAWSARGMSKQEDLIMDHAIDLHNSENGIVLMQSIGLRDKNGIEIYEGDVVRVNHPHDVTGDFQNTVGRVFWWQEEAAFYHGNSSGRPPKRMWEYSEVIGNIWEHPELLNSETNDERSVATEVQ